MALAEPNSVKDQEAADLAAGAFIAKVVIGANIALVLSAALVWQTSFRTIAYEALAWTVLVEALLLALVFMPLFLFRKIMRRESTKLAAARAITWFRDALASL